MQAVDEICNRKTHTLFTIKFTQGSSATKKINHDIKANIGIAFSNVTKAQS